MSPRRPDPPPGQGMPYPAQAPMYGPGPGYPPPQAAGQPMMARPRIEPYYANCVVVATSPREVSVIFGRYAAPYPGTEGQDVVPLFEKQILMTVEQAEELVKALGEAVEEFRTRLKDRPSKG